MHFYDIDENDEVVKFLEQYFYCINYRWYPKQRRKLK